MNQNNLSDVINFIKINKSFSDFNLVNNFALNFTKYRFNNNNKILKGGNNDMIQAGIATEPSIPMQPDIIPQPVMPIPPSMPMQAGMPMQPDIIPQPVMPMPPGMPIQPVIPPGMPIQPDIHQDEIDETIIPEIENLSEQIDEFGEKSTNFGVNDNEDCIYKKIRNEDGTIVTQRICSQKIITMPDMFLPKPAFMYSGTNTYTIRKGTILYHANINKRGFNTKEIKLGKDKLISFFTPNFRLASDKIEGCSIDKQKGFIHVFEVKQDIPDIFVKLPYDTDEELNIDELKDKFCNGEQYYKGVGFFYPKNEIELFNNSVLNQRTQEMHENLDDDSYYSEFALCFPGDYLTYLYSQKCMSLRKLSQPYRFDGKNFN